MYHPSAYYVIRWSVGDNVVDENSHTDNGIVGMANPGGEPTGNIASAASREPRVASMILRAIVTNRQVLDISPGPMRDLRQ